MPQRKEHYVQILKEYDDLVTDIIAGTMSMAHCDGHVLHAPQSCQYCDMYPELQEFRERYGIQFTNEEFDPLIHVLRCPALDRRPLEKIERWGGNISHVDLRPSCICYPGTCPQGCEPACPVC